MDDSVGNKTESYLHSLCDINRLCDQPAMNC